MTEFGDIFDEALTTTVYVYGSILFLAAYVIATMLVAGRRQSEGPSELVTVPSL